MASMSNREYNVRLAWLDRQMNEPSRSDFYLMQIAQEVRRVLSKKPETILLEDHFKIKFGRSSTEPKELTQEDKDRATAVARSRWMGLVGPGGKKK